MISASLCIARRRLRDSSCVRSNSLYFMVLPTLKNRLVKDCPTLKKQPEDL